MATPSLDNEPQKLKAAWDLETTYHFIQENPQYEKWRHKGLPYAHDLTALFKGAVATGKYSWAPSSGVLPNGMHEDDNGYHPCFESGFQDLEEGSGIVKKM
ncbi:hypothetical protein PIB30_013886 [Stylosanthes scabra]|uniref:Uncharacterized protein n=1 Tax=Stylosanthes scabra TaxID=79078 RepID=A0ABU6V879_9FABA|nr:hypothetical protein [Stylosanthes scabra]